MHEVWPGHYLQFLYGKTFPSDIRKVLGANSNSEGWAHYCEQMVIDEGFHADDPRYRLAQIQDALLRDVRFIVGIRMHTKGMTLAEAEEFFVKEGYQPRPVGRSESKRGTSDPTYGYYTMGKLMILKLRDDYKAKMGAGTRCRSSTTPSSVSGHCRCPSSAGRCSGRADNSSEPRTSTTDNTENTEHGQHGRLLRRQQAS